MVTLEKGKKINLSKELQTNAINGNNLVFGLGWAQVTSGRDIDCDAYILLLDEGSYLATSTNVIYYHRLKDTYGAIRHMGDNLVGGESDDLNGDSEQIAISLDKIPSHIKEVGLFVNIYHAYERDQHLGMLQNAYVRLFDASKPKSNIVYYALNENYDGYTNIHVATLHRVNDGWEFEAVGVPDKIRSIEDTTKKYKNNKPHTGSQATTSSTTNEKPTGMLGKLLKALFN